jgi:hypothetical protein
MKKLVFLLLVINLVSCNGSKKNKGPQTGRFIDAAVEGLDYSSATQSGKTDAEGKFQYLSGESVSFSLYGKRLLSPLGYEVLTPFDLNDSSLNQNYSINLVRFLMAIDEDQNPSNGIKLPEYDQEMDIEFSMSIQGFESDPKQISALDSIAPGRSLPSVQAAVEHVNESLSNIDPSYRLILTGKTARSVIKSSSCPSTQTGLTYSFGTSTLTAQGSDGFDQDCNPSETYNTTSNYADVEIFNCGPICNYKELNRVTYKLDSDNRTAVEWVWHTPNTNQVIWVKTILAGGNLSTYTEIVTLD